MNCPTDQTVLQIADRQGIEIDYCPTCRGVWLDRGELDKLIERSAEYEAPVRSVGRWEDDDDDDRRRGRWEDDRGHRLGKPRRKKRESFLGELFEFGE